MAKKRKNSWERLTPKQQHARAQRLARNPNTRASIPDQYLRGFSGADEYRRERAKNTRLNSPVAPGSDMSVRDLIREAQAQTQTRYGPEQRALQAQQQTSQSIQAQIPTWFQDYRNQLEQYRTQTQQAYQQANQQMVALQGQTAADQGQQQIAELQQQAKVTGANVDPALAEQAAQAAQVRQAMVGSQGGALAAQGAAQQANYGQLGLASQKGQTETLLRELFRGRQIQEEQQGLAREMGAYDVAQRVDIEDREKKAMLEQMLFATETQQKNEALELDRQQEASRRYDLIQDRKLARRRESRMSKTERERLDNEKERIRIQRENARKNGKGGGKGKGGKELGRPLKEPASSLGVRRRINQIKRDLDNRGFRSREEAKKVLRREAPHLFGSDQELQLSAALDLKFNKGRLSKGNVRALRNEGVFITTNGQYWAGGNRGA